MRRGRSRSFALCRPVLTPLSFWVFLPSLSFFVRIQLSCWGQCTCFRHTYFTVSYSCIYIKHSVLLRYEKINRAIRDPTPPVTSLYLPPRGRHKLPSFLGTFFFQFPEKCLLFLWVVSLGFFPHFLSSSHPGACQHEAYKSSACATWSASNLPVFLDSDQLSS